MPQGEARGLGGNHSCQVAGIELSKLSDDHHSNNEGQADQTRYSDASAEHRLILASPKNQDKVRSSNSRTDIALRIRFGKSNLSLKTPP